MKDGPPPSAVPGAGISIEEYCFGSRLDQIYSASALAWAVAPAPYAILLRVSSEEYNDVCGSSAWCECVLCPTCMRHPHNEQNAENRCSGTSWEGQGNSSLRRMAIARSAQSMPRGVDDVRRPRDQSTHLHAQWRLVYTLLAPSLCAHFSASHHREEDFLFS